MLRFEGHSGDGTPVGDTILLTVHPDNLNRIVNQWRYLLSDSPLSFKPVFARRERRFELVPIAVNTYPDFRMLAETPSRILDGEFFAPTQPHLKSKVRGGFPYTAALLRVSWRIVSSIDFRRAGSPVRHLNFPVWYDNSRGPDEVKLATLKYVVERFSSDCSSLKKRCAVLLIPDPELLYMWETSGAHELQALRAWVPAATEVVDLTPILYKAFGEKYCDYLTRPAECAGHFSPPGNEAVARAVRDALKAE